MASWRPPGAIATMREGLTNIGSGVFEDVEGARLNVDPAFTVSDVQAFQSIPGLGNGPSISRTPMPLPGQPQEPLIAPEIDPAPVACNTAIKISKVYDGAEVTVRRDNGVRTINLSYMFDAPALLASVGLPLEEGEILTISQAVAIHCERYPATGEIRVGSAPPIPKPVVRGPLCSGSSTIVVENLIPGAAIEVFANEKTYRAQTPSSTSSLTIIIEPLEAPPPGQTRLVYARQEQCGIFGPNSDGVKVEPLPAQLPVHQIVKPIYACSQMVRVVDAHPNATLMVISDLFGPISGFENADSTGKAVVFVAPQLIKDDTIVVLQWACGGAASKAVSKVENSLERLTIPSVGDVFVGSKIVSIVDLIPGSTVEAVVIAKNGTIREVASFVAQDKEWAAIFQKPLQGGERVRARQSLCTLLSGFSADRAAVVMPIQPDWWKWDTANRNEEWSKDYVVSGSFTNRGGTPIQDLSITIFEDSAANVADTSHPLVLPMQTVKGATDTINKDWKWFINGVWFVQGPLYKKFQYRAQMTAKDVDGNSYPVVSSSDLVIYVNVPKWKRTAGALAMGAAASAAAMAASVVLMLGAGAAYAAAAVAGAVALDPPVPDPNFKEHIPLPGLKSVSSKGKDQEIIRIFRLVEQIMSIHLTKSLIEGRRLGALAAGDDSWVIAHANDLFAATLMQKQLTQEVLALGPDATGSALDLIPFGTDLKATRASQMIAGLTTNDTANLDLSASQLREFNEVIQSDIVATEPNIEASIKDTLDALAGYIDSIE
jgi:hypothetical protein